MWWPVLCVVASPVCGGQSSGPVLCRVGTPKVTSTQVGTSPDVVEDLGPVVRELRARLAGSAKELRSCQEELSIANREVKTMNNEVEK